MDLSEYLRILRKRWLVVTLAVVLGALAGVAATALTPPVYSARTQLFISADAGSANDALIQGSTFAEKQVESYSAVIRSDKVLATVVDQLGLDETSRQLAQRVSATVPTGQVLIDVTVTDADPAVAADIANAIASRFTSVASELAPRNSNGRSTITVTVLQPALPPAEPSAPSAKLNIGLGVLVGLAIGICLALARDALDTRVKGERDVRLVTDSPVIGRIPSASDAREHPLPVVTSDQSLRAEAFRQLRTNLQFLQLDHPDRMFVITSSVPEEGKSTTAANLAIALAQAGRRVCLVDADLRRPMLGRLLGAEDAAGLTGVLIGELTLDEALQPWGGVSLELLLAGRIPPNPSELLGGSSMTALLAELQNRFDVVIIDSPPLLPVTDAVLLARHAGGAVVVVGASRVKRAELEVALGHLTSAGAPLSGIVLNRMALRGAEAMAYMRDYAPRTPPEAKGRKARKARKAEKIASRSSGTPGEPNGAATQSVEQPPISDGAPAHVHAARHADDPSLPPTSEADDAPSVETGEEAPRSSDQRAGGGTDPVASVTTRDDDEATISDEDDVEAGDDAGAQDVAEPAAR